MEESESSQPERRDLDRYTGVLEQMAVRGDLAAGWVGGATPTYPNAEAAALNLRMILELIPMLGLLASRELVEPVAAAFQRKAPMDAYKLVKGVNPDFWPRPILQVPMGDGSVKHRLQPVTDGFVREDEWLAEWGWLSSLLHARNPYKGEPELRPTWGRLRRLHERITRLLSVHQMVVPGMDGFIIGMVRTETGESGVYEFVRNEELSRESADGGGAADADTCAATQRTQQGN